MDERKKAKKKILPPDGSEIHKPGNILRKDVLCYGIFHL
jgi:hypothetical protein